MDVVLVCLLVTLSMYLPIEYPLVRQSREVFAILQNIYNRIYGKIVYWFVKSCYLFSQKVPSRIFKYCKPPDIIIQTLNISLVNTFRNIKPFSFLFQVVFCNVISIRHMCCYFFHCVCICFRLHGKI